MKNKVVIENIKIEDDVRSNNSPSRERPGTFKARNPNVEYVVETFKTMRPGQSFFVEGVLRRDLDFLRRPFRAEGLGYLMKHMPCDPIYQVAGVRVWRQPGEFDEL